MKIRMTIKITNFLTQSAGQEMIVITSLGLPVKRIYKEALSSKKGRSQYSQLQPLIQFYA